MSQAPLDLDVRPILRSGEEPFSAIMQAVDLLAPGQGLRLLATFKPVPLFQVLGARGFEPTAREIDDGDWEVLFTPARAQAKNTSNAFQPKTEGDWPSASIEIDCRDLLPPEPMVQVLKAAEVLSTGETMAALLPREPSLLFPELRDRGYAWLGEQKSDGSYRIIIRRREK